MTDTVESIRNRVARSLCELGHSRTAVIALFVGVVLATSGCDYLVRMDTSSGRDDVVEIAFFKDNDHLLHSREKVSYLEVERVFFDKIDAFEDPASKSELVWALDGSATVDRIIYGQVPSGMVEIVKAIPLRANSLYFVSATIEATFDTAIAGKYFETDATGTATPLSTREFWSKYLKIK